MADQNTIPIPQGASLGDPISSSSGGVPIPQGATLGDPINLTDNVAARHARSVPTNVNYGQPDNTGVLANVATGMAKGAGESVQGASNLLGMGKIVNEGMLGDTDTSAQGTSQMVGKGAEGVGEFALGDEMFGGIAKLAKIPEPLLALAEKYPKAAKMILSGAKGAVVGGTQGAIKGAAEGQTKTGAEGGAVGGSAGESLGEGVQSITNSELAKAFMNRASGVTKAMIRYGQDPAKALVDEDLPVFSTLSNRGREAAAEAKLNELKPQLDNALQTSPHKVNWRGVLNDTFENARNKINEIETMSDEEKSRAINNIQTLENNLAQKWPDGNMTPLEANELKTRIQSHGADYDTKPDSSDLLRNFYNEAQGKLKDTVNQFVPGVRDINQRVSNLIALKNAAHETILAERAGLGPLSGMGVARKAEAAIGHAAPIAAKVAKAAPETGGIAGSTIGRVIFQATDGSMHSVPEDQLDKAKQIDPGLKIKN